MTILRENFKFKNRSLNPTYETGLLVLPLRSCLIRNNSKNLIRGNEQLILKKRPKWLTTMTYDQVDQESGELLLEGDIYQSDDFKAANSRKIRALDAFCDHFQPLYTKRQVSMLFHTFTQANQAKMPFREMLENVKYHYKEQLARPILGFIWTLEISEKHHVHYHLCTAISRLSVQEIPTTLKLEELWGRRTGVEFVRKNVKHYMAKYFAKSNARCMGMRSYGRSSSFGYPN